ncbi:MAG: ATP-binding protein [Sedimentibacter sp.]
MLFISQIFQGARLGFDETICLECDISEQNIEKLCRDIATRTHVEVKKKDLVNMKVLKQSGDDFLPTNAFALLPSDFFEYAYIQCARFKGANRSVFIDRKEYTGSIYKQVENAFAFVKNHINLGAEINGLYRNDNYELPIASIREMIINAVVHRNYVINNSAIQLAVYDDRLEVTSPGMLVGQLDINMIKEGRSEIRNQTISCVFKKMNLIERWGTGVNRIIQECQEYGLKEPKFEEIGNSFRVTIFRKLKASELVNKAANEAEAVILEKLKLNNKESRKSLVELTEFSNSKVYRTLNSLKEKGIIERVGSNKNGHWKFLKQ